MSILGKVLENVTFGVVHEVSDVDEPPPVLTADPIQPRQNLSAPASTPRFVAADTDIEKAATKNAGADLETVLGATSSKFQAFLQKKQEFVEVLKEAGTPGDRIESVATAKALQTTKLSIADINAAKAAALESLNGLKRQMAEEIEAQRDSDVTKPNESIAATQTQITSLRQKVTEIEKQISTLQAGIDPARQAIAVADGKLTHAQKVFELSCTMVVTNLDAIEAAIMAALRKP